MNVTNLSCGTAVVLPLAACQPGTAVIEGIQGEEATRANHTLLVKRFMASDCQTLTLQEQSLRRVVTNPLLNISGGGLHSQNYKAIVEVMKKKGCAS